MSDYFAKECLYSVVKNTSGAAMAFGFLPPHGVTLAANESYTVFGNILEAINKHGDRLSNHRNHQAFVNALNAGRITVVSGPAQVLQDAVTGLTKILHLASGTLSTVNACWAHSDSEYAGAPA